MANRARVSESTSALYCGFVRERVILRTSATTPICALLSRSTNSLTGRVECPMVKNGCAICHFGLPAYAPKRTRLVQSHMIGLVALNFVLRVLLARVVDISFVIHVLRVHLDDSATDSSGLRIPTHPITLSECFCHDQTCAACRPLLLALLWQILSGAGFPNQFFC